MSDQRHDVRVATISSDDVTKHVANGDVFLLDVRQSTGKHQIYGAIRYDPGKLLAAERLVLPLPHGDGLIVVYDEDGHSADTGAIGAKLLENGFSDVRRLEGGFAAYERSGGKVEDMTLEQPVPLAGEHQLDR